MRKYKGATLSMKTSHMYISIRRFRPILTRISWELTGITKLEYYFDLQMEDTCLHVNQRIFKDVIFKRFSSWNMICTQKNLSNTDIQLISFDVITYAYIILPS